MVKTGLDSRSTNSKLRNHWPDLGDIFSPEPINWAMGRDGVKGHVGGSPIEKGEVGKAVMGRENNCK